MCHQTNRQLFEEGTKCLDTCNFSREKTTKQPCNTLSSQFFALQTRHNSNNDSKKEFPQQVPSKVLRKCEYHILQIPKTTFFL